jgi:tRNA(Ile)-lysidine synthase
VATAHTADDQVETILHNILRGTGLAGLAGIPKLRRLTDATTLVRPMLQITRAEVLDYLKVLQQPFREDSTNQLIAYTRNRIRQQLLPLLERDFNPRVREALLRLGHIATETDEYLTQQATALLPTISRPTPTGVEIDVQQLQSAHPARVRHVMMLVWEQEDWPLQDMSFEKWETLRLMLENDSERAMQTLPGGISVERRGNVLQLTRPS